MRRMISVVVSTYLINSNETIRVRVQVSLAEVLLKEGVNLPLFVLLLHLWTQLRGRFVLPHTSVSLLWIVFYESRNW